MGLIDVFDDLSTPKQDGNDAFSTAHHRRCKLTPPPFPATARTSALLVANTIISRRLAEPVLYSKALRAFLVSSDMPGLDLLPKKASASSINRSRPLPVEF